MTRNAGLASFRFTFVAALFPNLYQDVFMGQKIRIPEKNQNPDQEMIYFCIGHTDSFSDEFGFCSPPILRKHAYVIYNDFSRL